MGKRRSGSHASVLAVAVVLVTAACGSGSSGDGEAAKAPAASTTSVPAGSAGDGTTTAPPTGPSANANANAKTKAKAKTSATTTPATTGSGAGGSATAAGSGSATAAGNGTGGRAGNGPTNVPPAGRSTYHATGTYTSGTGPTAKTEKIDRTETDDVTVTPIPGGGDEVKVVTTTDGERRETLYRITDATAVVVEMKTETPQRTTVVRPNPPMTVAQFPLTVGKTWNIQWRDDANGVQGAGTGTVARIERVGRTDATVIELRQTLSGTVTGRLDIDAWVDQATGRQLRQHFVIDIQLGASRDVVDYTRELN